MNDRSDESRTPGGMLLFAATFLSWPLVMSAFLLSLSEPDDRQIFVVVLAGWLVPVLALSPLVYRAKSVLGLLVRGTAVQGLGVVASSGAAFVMAQKHASFTTGQLFLFVAPIVAFGGLVMAVVVPLTTLGAFWLRERLSGRPTPWPFG